MKTVNIQGEAYPIKFGLSAIQEVVRLAGGKSLKDLSSLDDLEVGKIPAFIMTGLKSGAKIAAIDPPKLEAVKDELETNFPLFMEVMGIFGDDISPENEINEKAGN